jgi:soluble lytic murein transglycosylase-like protein
MGGKGVRSLFPERPDGCFAEKTPDPFSEVATMKTLPPRAAKIAFQALLATSAALGAGTGCSRQLYSETGPQLLVAPPPPDAMAAIVEPAVRVEEEAELDEELRLSERYDAFIVEYAEQYGVEPALVKAVVHAESNFDRDAVSHRGARGLMQLMPRTARGYGARDLHDPRENIRVGVAHLRRLLDRFKSPRLALAAYNAGASTVHRHRGLPPCRETRKYVERVLRLRTQYRENASGSADGFVRAAAPAEPVRLGARAGWKAARSVR